MSQFDTLSDLPAVIAELDAGTRAIDEGQCEHAHAILLTLFLAPELPAWFRELSCTPPLRKLAETYLPTRAALRRMRERAATKLLCSDQSVVWLHRALALNDALSDPRASYKLLLKLDVVAHRLLVQSRDTSVDAFSMCDDWTRARRYLGNFREAMVSTAKHENDACAVREFNSWGRVDLLAHVARYARQLGVNERVLRANGERTEAAQVAATGVRLITDRGFRRHLEREMDQPGTSLEELRAELCTHSARRTRRHAMVLEASHAARTRGRDTNTGLNLAR